MCRSLAEPARRRLSAGREGAVSEVRRLQPWASSGARRSYFANASTSLPLTLAHMIPRLPAVTAPVQCRVEYVPRATTPDAGTFGTSLRTSTLASAHGTATAITCHALPPPETVPQPR